MIKNITYNGKNVVSRGSANTNYFNSMMHIGDNLLINVDTNSVLILINEFDTEKLERHKLDLLNIIWEPDENVENTSEYLDKKHTINNNLHIKCENKPLINQVYAPGFKQKSKPIKLQQDLNIEQQSKEEIKNMFKPEKTYTLNILNIISIMMLSGMTEFSYPEYSIHFQLYREPDKLGVIIKDTGYCLGYVLENSEEYNNPSITNL